MEKLLAPPPFSQQDFWEAFPTIREEFSGFWGIFWRFFGKPSPSRDLQPRFFKDFPQKSRVQSRFSEPQIPFFRARL